MQKSIEKSIEKHTKMTSKVLQKTFYPSKFTKICIFQRKLKKRM